MESLKYQCGHCPDEQCQATLFFRARDSNIECTGCGQRHEKNMIRNIAEVTNPEIVVHNVLKNILLGHSKPKKCSDTVKVLGLSNFQCKLLSPLLTIYGMEKQTGQAKLLQQMGPNRTFDCSVLGNRAFLISRKNLEIVGYGRDKTGSQYLMNTMDAIQKYNNNEERLVPIHADGDGHCLVHAVSRALIGRELFWHALRENLQEHITARLDDYKAMFCDFVEEEEWAEIIAECDPLYIPTNGEPMGLRNIHIFGLANVLHRPIILLDSITGIQSSADYTGVFLPGLEPPEKCRDKDGALHKPITLAWSNHGRNHYIALVAVKGGELPRLPQWMTPKTWGIPQSETHKYIEFDSEGAITIGGNNSLQDRYILRLVAAMETVFVEQNGVSTSLVADVHQYVFKSTGMVGTVPEVVIEATQNALREHRLFRCLTCEAITEWKVPGEYLSPGGRLYQLAVDSHGPLNTNKSYSFPSEDLVCRYDVTRDVLVPDMQNSKLEVCRWCNGTKVRAVNVDGTPIYENGDRTTVRAPTSRCHCGYKHYWNGHLYDNHPDTYTVPLEWAGKSVMETVAWFQYESDPSLNSNVYEVAQQLVQKHFPGEFGSERLVQKIVDTLLLFTAKKPPVTSPAADDMETEVSAAAAAADDSAMIDPLNHNIPTKIILEGQQRQSIHKEHLNKSETERQVRHNIESKAAAAQNKRKTDVIKKDGGVSSASSLQLKHSASSPTRAQVKQAKISQTVDSTPALTHEGQTGSLVQGQSSNTQQHGTPEATVSSLPKLAKVKVTTNDGRQLMLTLSDVVTYDSVTEQLSLELSTPRDRMKIKYGFPPKLLQAPADGAHDAVVPIQHGDRLSVEIAPLHETVKSRVPDQLWPAQPDSSNSWSHFNPNAHDTSAQKMLKGLEDLQNTSGKSDAIDTAITSLALMALLQNKDLWTMVQTMPHLFSVGGLFYQQVKRDTILTHEKHYEIPILDRKVFRYNATDERLELCLEPHGHYPVEPGIEARILNSSLINMAHQQGIFPKEIGTGSSGVVVGKAEKTVGKPVAFQGQGHSLRSSADVNAQMPKQLTSARKHRASARFRKLSSDSVESPILEEEDMDSEEKLSDSGTGDVMTRASDATSTSDRDLVRDIISQVNDLSRADAYADTDTTASSTINNISNSNVSSSSAHAALPATATAHAVAGYHKLGPSYSVVHKPQPCAQPQQTTKLTDQQQQEFHSIASQLEALVEESETESLQESSIDETKVQRPQPQQQQQQDDVTNMDGIDTAMAAAVAGSNSGSHGDDDDTEPMDVSKGSGSV